MAEGKATFKIVSACVMSNLDSSLYKARKRGPTQLSRFACCNSGNSFRDMVEDLRQKKAEWDKINIKTRNSTAQ